MASSERLQKLMARAGLGSRRACEEIIRNGRVTLNGRLAVLGDRADPAVDHLLIDGEPLENQPERITIALYKPAYHLTTDAPHRGDQRPTARSLIPLEARLFPVGRLDADSEGLVLFTNDGNLANRLSHPRYQHEKEYRVLVVGRPSEETLETWRRGVILVDEGADPKGRRTAPAEVSVVPSAGKPATDATWLNIVLQEGRKRQIRRVAAALEHRVIKLIRTRIGSVRLHDLKPKEWRPLTKQEARELDALCARRPRSRAKSRKSWGPSRPSRGGGGGGDTSRPSRSESRAASRPSGGASRPSRGASRPSGGESRPSRGGTSRPSGGGTSRSSRGTSRSSRGTSRPSGGESRPSRGASRPSGGASRPSRGASRPSGGESRPSRGGTSRPSGGGGGGGTSRSSRGTSRPSRDASRPSGGGDGGGGTSRSSRGTSRPSRDTSRPSRAASRPSGGASRPSRGASRPSGGGDGGGGTSRSSRGTSRPSRDTSRPSGGGGGGGTSRPSRGTSRPSGGGGGGTSRSSRETSRPSRGASRPSGGGGGGGTSRSSRGTSRPSRDTSRRKAASTSRPREKR